MHFPEQAVLGILARQKRPPGQLGTGPRKLERPKKQDPLTSRDVGN
jgi:hypothetical protein